MSGRLSWLIIVLIPGVLLTCRKCVKYNTKLLEFNLKPAWQRNQSNKCWCPGSFSSVFGAFDLWPSCVWRLFSYLWPKRLNVGPTIVKLWGDLLTSWFSFIQVIESDNRECYTYGDLTGIQRCSESSLASPCPADIKDTRAEFQFTDVTNGGPQAPAVCLRQKLFSLHCLLHLLRLCCSYFLIESVCQETIMTLSPLLSLSLCSLSFSLLSLSLPSHLFIFNALFYINRWSVLGGIPLLIIIHLLWYYLIISNKAS